MVRIKATLGGVEYTGLPLTVDAVEEIQRTPAEKLFMTAIRLWLDDPETAPAAPSPLRLFPAEATKAAMAILGLSGLAPGEAAPGTESAH